MLHLLHLVILLQIFAFRACRDVSTVVVVVGFVWVFELNLLHMNLLILSILYIYFADRVTIQGSHCRLIE